MYNLILKNTSEIVDRTSANSLKEAVSFFRGRKQMDKKSFNKLFDVCHSSSIKK